MAHFEGTPGNDRIHGKENIRTVIHGLGGDDVLFGGNKDDRLVGGAGDDLLYGGAGGDTMSGGAGKDAFVFTAVSDSPAIATDTILHFQSGKDTLVFRGEFRDAGTLHLIGGNAFSGTPGEVRYGGGHDGGGVQIDMDGDGHADVAIIFLGDTQIQASDFSF